MAISNSQLLNNQSQYVKLSSGKVQNICCQPFELKKKIAEIEKGIPFEDLLLFQTEANQMTSNSQAFQNLWYVVDSKKQNQENQLLKKNLLVYEEQLKVAQLQLNNLETQLQEALEQNQQLIDNNQKQKNLSEASFKEQFDQQIQNFQDQIKSLQQNESAKINQLVIQHNKQVEGLTLKLNQITTQFNESQRIKGEQEKLIATLQTDLAKTISMNQDWEKSYQEVVKKNKENEEYLQKYYEQTYQQQLQTIYESCINQYNTYSSEIQKQLTTIFQEKEDLQQNLNNLREENSKLEQQVRGLLNDKGLSTKEIEQVQGKLNNSNQEIESLKTEIQKLGKDQINQSMPITSQRFQEAY